VSKKLEVEEAMQMLEVTPDYNSGGGPTDCVHTFRIGGGMCLGAHWPLESARRDFEKYGVEVAGEPLVGHGLLMVDDSGPVVFATNPSKEGG